eukprot:TRINITY_DN896_c0_g1_i1.p1 TRINITY_DN896_c0_g1~~TRINITY_DN896_c0_g1_i1.p1  ORF type:complete len:121 (-),score=30.89 TRINITY_DN896_c0_g1_i1:87-449(-)
MAIALGLIVMSQELTVMKISISQWRNLTMERMIRINNQHIKVSGDIMWMNEVFGAVTAFGALNNSLTTVIILTRRVLNLDPNAVSEFASNWWFGMSAVLCGGEWIGRKGGGEDGYGMMSG